MIYDDTHLDSVYRTEVLVALVTIVFVLGVVFGFILGGGVL